MVLWQRSWKAEFISASLGLAPSERMNVPSSVKLTKPSFSLSKRSNASWNSASCSSVRLNSFVVPKIEGSTDDDDDVDDAAAISGCFLFIFIFLRFIDKHTFSSRNGCVC